MDINEVLTILEKRPMTVENLAHRLDVPMPEMAEFVQQLTDKGYIEAAENAGSNASSIGTAAGFGAATAAAVGATAVGAGLAAAIGTFGIATIGGVAIGSAVAAALSSRNMDKKLVKEGAYFILTSKGHARLHPFISLGDK